MAKAEAKPKKGKVEWRTSAAREIVLEDVDPGGWLHDGDDMSPLIVCNLYRYHHPAEFEFVEFDQFQARLSDHRDDKGKRRKLSRQEEEWMNRDRKTYPRQSHNARGEPVFDMDEAKLLLRQDIIDGVHLQHDPESL